MAASSDEEAGPSTSELDEDYYTFLNIRREATSDEINNAYRRLSRLYHPDKHSDPLKKRHADVLFGKTKKAYEVLSDPHRRAIYDSLGTKGLETEGWEMVQRTKTPQEIREEYERLARERDERKLQQRTNPKGAINVNINATDLFDSYEVDEARGFPQLEVSGMSISQSIEAPLTLSDTMTLGGQLQTHNGNGSGTISCAWRRVISAKTWTEMEFGAGNGALLSLRVFRTISKRSFANMAGIFQLTPHGIRPGIQTVIGRQLDKHTMGYLTWKAGLQSCMNAMVVWDTSSGHFVCSLQLGIPNSFAMVGYTHKFQEDAKLRGSVKFGTFGLLLEYGCEKRISQHSILGANVSVGIPTGVTLKIKVNRGNQNYVFPIFLSEQILPSPIFYGTVVPVIAYYATKVFIITPYLKQQKKKEADKQKEANASKIAEKRREAEAAISLMQETYQRIVDQEIQKKGLVISKAVYGKLVLESESYSTTVSEVVDVKIPLQCLVKDSKLILHETSKCQLPGFYDPCVGEEKSLYIQYQFHDLDHEVTLGDEEMVRIPKQTHRMES